jgi:hypothetical protein
METFPTQASDLGKEIAAFATSNSGTILLGVSNDAEVIGLPDAATPAQRDALTIRIEGIAHGQVVPSITPVLDFYSLDEKVVMVLRVPKGSEPVYYCQGRPYLRHLTSSRPGAPHEVKELTLAWARANLLLQRAERTRTESFALTTLRLLGEAEMWLNGLDEDEWFVHPHLEELQANLETLGREVRKRAVDDQAKQLDLSEKLRAVADSLTTLAGHEFYIDGGMSLARFRELGTAARQEIATIVGMLRGHIRQSPDDLQAFDESLKSQVAELGLLTEDLPERARTRDVEGIQRDLLEIGSNLYQLGVLAEAGIVPERPYLASTLKRLGATLRNLFTFRFYLDGGASLLMFVEIAQGTANEARGLVP